MQITCKANQQALICTDQGETKQLKQITISGVSIRERTGSLIATSDSDTIFDCSPKGGKVVCIHTRFIGSKRRQSPEVHMGTKLVAPWIDKWQELTE